MISKDLVAASSIPLILSILAVGESYGYAIIKSVRELSANRLEWTDGMLYPVLHKLEEQKMVVSAWRTARNRRKRKYYRITRAGRRELERLRGEWDAVHKALNKAWDRLEE
jgi:DNA-binding PadR family transcriptional regulator